MSTTRTLLCTALLISILSISKSAMGGIYISGHADLGVGFENGNLHLHIHAENPLNLFGGGILAAGEYDPGDVDIGVPNPAVLRPVGAQWNFLATAANAPVWFLPQGSDPNKPFVGLGTEELTPANGWTTPLTWTFNSITPVSGDNSSFAIWQLDALGSPVIFASSIAPTLAGNKWTQSPLSHNHFNFGFTGQGVYDVSLTIEGRNTTLNHSFSDTASYRFVTGSAITAVPEPSSLLLLGLSAVVTTLKRHGLRKKLANCLKM